MRSKRSVLQGFTLVEMMLVVAIMGILTSIALPYFGRIVEAERAKGAAVDLYVALTRTRSEALRLNQNVTLSPIAADWNEGWQILDPVTSAVIDSHVAVSGITITGPTSVTYRSSGRVLSSGSFTISGSYSGNTRYVCLDLSGRPAINTSGTCS